MADEICYIDNVATLYGTNNLSNFISDTAKNIFVPISVGGGIRSLQDIERIFKAGADKVCINSAAIDNPKFLNRAAKIFGSANITINIEYIKIKKKFFITKSTGRDIVDINPFEWAKIVEQNGAGEVFLTSVNHEGLGNGFDVDMIKRISNNISIPVIAHGGAGNFNHIKEVIKKTNISGVAISSLAHYDIANTFENKKKSLGNFNYLEESSKKNKPKNIIRLIKKNLKKEGFNVRI